MAETWTIPLAREGVFRTVQGEGVLSGFPMVFLRVAGCSVGCPGCDTDYKFHERLTADQLRKRINNALSAATRWLWVTGGEPTDHDLDGVLLAGRSCGLRLALATAGTRQVRKGLWDFVSVSPHRLDSSWAERVGDQLNVVPRLNGLRLEDLAGSDVSGFPEGARFVTPNDGGTGRPTNALECADFVGRNAGWRMGVQGHKNWGLP